MATAEHAAAAHVLEGATQQGLQAVEGIDVGEARQPDASLAQTPAAAAPQASAAPAPDPGGTAGDERHSSFRRACRLAHRWLVLCLVTCCAANNVQSRAPCSCACALLYGWCAVLTPEPGCRGVSWHKASERWRASIKIGGKKVSLGSYVDEEQAARIFDSEAVRHGPPESNELCGCAFSCEGAVLPVAMQ